MPTLSATRTTEPAQFSKNQKKLVALFEKRVILSAGAMLIYWKLVKCQKPSRARYEPSLYRFKLTKCPEGHHNFDPLKI